MTQRIWTISFMVMIVSGGCNQQLADQKTADQAPEKKVTSDDVRRDVGQAMKTAAEYSEQAKEEFRKKLDARLKEMDHEIARLREKGRDMTGEAKVKLDKKLAELETKRDAARDKLAEVGQSGAEAWKDIQKGAQSAWDEMDKALDEASREF